VLLHILQYLANAAVLVVKLTDVHMLSIPVETCLR